MKPTYFLAFMFLPLLLPAQAVRQPLSAAFAGTAAYSNSFADVFSGTLNQAAFAKFKTPVFGVLAERRFLLQEMNQFSAVVAMPTASGVFAFQGDYFGFSDFAQSRLGLAYARQLSSKIEAGIKFNWYNLRMAGYGSAASINFEGGAIVHLTSQLNAGFHLYNPLGSKLGKIKGEKLPSVYKAGFGYQSSKLFFIGAEIVRNEDVPVSVQVGLQYRLHERFYLRCGISTYGSNNYAGVGVQAGLMRIDINASYHQNLGFTPGIGIVFNLKKPAED